MIPLIVGRTESPAAPNRAVATATNDLTGEVCGWCSTPATRLDPLFHLPACTACAAAAEKAVAQGIEPTAPRQRVALLVGDPSEGGEGR